MIALGVGWIGIVAVDGQAEPRLGAPGPEST